MKKTFITLCAVAAVVCAHADQAGTQLYSGSSTSLTNGNADISWTTSDVASPLSSYMFTFSFDAESKMGNVNVANVAVFATNTAAGSLGIFTPGNYSTGLYLGITSGGYNLDSTAATSDSFSFNGNSEVAADFHKEETLTFAFDATTGTAYLYNATSGAMLTYALDTAAEGYDASACALSSAGLHAYTHGGNLKLNLGTVTDLSAAAAAGTFVDAVKGVPEPTTATLSLLALAGLAARRRRK